MKQNILEKSIVGYQLSKKEILDDYYLVIQSREMSLIGRKEVFLGKAKFGIFGSGKEVPQVALAKFFQNGDWRSGYYRDQTLMMAIDQLTVPAFFAQLYAHADVNADPVSAGRMMNCHFGTRYLNEKGDWLTHTDKKNSSADISPTAGQMPRLLGLAYASKLYREIKELQKYKDFSIHGNEVAFGTIGNAATSEGLFWETMNAAAVLQVPIVMSVWDDAYGISVSQKFHTVKESISEALKGFESNEQHRGIDIHVVRAWDYPNLIQTYQAAVDKVRKTHTPCLVHVIEATQPQGHSTSGSHERYKSVERLNWEKEFDCIKKMREWILNNSVASEDELEVIENRAKAKIKEDKVIAWKTYSEDINRNVSEAGDLIDKAGLSSSYKKQLSELSSQLRKELTPDKSLVMSSVKKALRLLRKENIIEKKALQRWLNDVEKVYTNQYNSKLYSNSPSSALNTPTTRPQYTENSNLVDGKEVLNACFDTLMANDSRIFAVGEDVGTIGDVNQGMVGLQHKYGSLRVTDTGIREATIIGQGIGAAIRGLKPIVEIQYLDYLLFAIQTLSDDLATLYYRTYGGQKAPVIVRTRGHRLEGIWHSGSPMGMIINALKGMYIITPRNMTQAAGFYHTLMASDDPALIIEPLNCYRIKEKMPSNLGNIKVALGEPDILREGKDITIVTYGSTCRIVMEAANQLAKEGIDSEVIDIQTLIPFDRFNIIKKSLEKTNRMAVVDEDVKGGCAAFIFQQVLESQNGYFWLDSKPITISGKDHRPAYGSDGDYFSKPNTEEIFDKIYKLFSELKPHKFPEIY